MDVIKDGKPVARIVLPAETEHELAAKALPQPAAGAPAAPQQQDEEVLAAEELRSILERMSGAKLTVERAQGNALPQGPAILIGATFARAAGFGERIDKLDKDGLLCAVKGEHLVLSGRRARGTLFAAYEFLEELGCRWVMPGPFGEIYPLLQTISTTVDKVEDPSHSQRYWWCTYGHAEGYLQWTLRNKGNALRAPGDPVVEQSHGLAQPLAWGATQEKYRVKGTKEGEWVLPDEHFAIQNGKPATHTPNFSNPRTWELYADYYVKYFNDYPDAGYVSISAEDGLVIDERPESRRLASNDYDRAMGAMSATDQLWFFHNRVIERVMKVHPTKKFGVLVYSNNLTPPRIERVHPNMALVFAPLGVCPLHHVRDDKCKTNGWYREWLEDWMAQAKAAGAETYYYDYEPMGYCWNMAMICPRWGIIGRNYPWFHEMGLGGHTTQGHDDWASSGLNNYLMQRLYWDVTQDYKEIIADYCKARFGAAAPIMVEYYDLLERRMAEIPDLYSNEVWANHLILTPEVRKGARDILDRAVAAADTERAKAHVKTMVDLQRSTDAACDAVEHADETGDFGKAAEMMKPIWEVRDKLNKLYPNFMQATRLSEKEQAQYLTGGIYNQYLGFDKKIKGAAASVLLPRTWKGKLDTRNRAAIEGYHKPGAAIDKLDDFDVTVCPDVKFHTQRDVAGFFYRTEADVPQAFAGRKVTLYFPSVIAKGLQIWVNGQPVEFDNGTFKDTTWRGPDYFWVDYNHEREFDITTHVKPGERNVIAFRVFKSFDFGGTYRRVFLLAN